MTKDAQVFKYETPDTDFEKGSKSVSLCQTDILVCRVQVFKEGGETRLHSHQHFDGAWMVLAGKVRFYGDNDELLGEFGKYEGIMVPRDFKYWFESADPAVPAELLQVEASDIPLERFFKGRENVIERLDGLVRTIPG
jgi:mannose-6-phosphate isomerase-like protein (cupin superfamily)